MRTHLELDDALLDQVLQLGHFSTKTAAVNAALSEYVKLLKRRQFLDLRGKITWQGNLERLRTHRGRKAP